MELARHAFVSLPRAQAPAVRAPDRRSELVLIERLTAAVQARLGAISHIAPTKKAWVDLFRLIIDAEYPVSPFEAGRMLGAGIRAGVIDRRRRRRIRRAESGGTLMHSPSHRFAGRRHASSQQLSNAPIERRSDIVWQRDCARCLDKRFWHARAQLLNSLINLRRR